MSAEEGEEMTKPSPAPAGTRTWTAAEAWIAWLIATIAPALTFDANLTLDSDLGLKFQAFFQILCTALFILVWVRVRRFPLPALLAIAAGAVVFFVGYTILREAWTCQYLDEGRVMTGTQLVPGALDYLRENHLLSAPCADQMSPFGGQGERMWPFRDLARRFLLLFAVYAVAWLTLALLVIGTLQERRMARRN